MADRIIPTDDKTPVPQTACESRADRELSINVNAQWGWAQYEGTRAQLEGEGLIPGDFDWPHAAADRRWSANGFDYWLRRTRPDGHKGPMRSWLEIDNWFVRVEVTGRDHRHLARLNLERKAEELRAEYHRQTVAGQREWEAKWKRYWKASNDDAFRAFKAIFIPERKKPGRKPKAA
jgi:hypothetical protein